jgi:solute carrier family 34 (sodium-dependent phosphate cotransporter)
MNEPEIRSPPTPLIDDAAPPPHHAAQSPPSRGVFAVLIRIGAAVLGIAIFIIALELLKTGAAAYGRNLIGALNITTPVNTLGFGWLLAYIFLSGSPVAAVAVSFFAAGTIDALQTFTMITGSRLGASFIVLFVGFLYYLRGHKRSDSVAIGVLALLTTAAIYLPALALGVWLINRDLLGLLSISAEAPLRTFLDPLLEPLIGVATQFLPGWALIPGGALALLLAFQLIDRALPNLDSEQSNLRRIGRVIANPLAMFLLGAGITSVTLSVSISLAILVPLAARGLVRRANSIPYIMGANITTFIDTLVAALLVGGPAAFTIVLIEMLSVTVLSLAVLAFAYTPFERTLLHTQEWVTRSNRTLAIFLGIILLIPALLVWI